MKRLYWDLDGVLVDLEVGLSKFAKHNAGKDISFMHGDPNCQPQSEYRKWLRLYAQKGGFVSAPATKQIQELCEIAEYAKSRNVFQSILTSRGNFNPPDEQMRYIVAQKASWVSTYKPFNEFTFIATTSGSKKALFADPDSLLIDDYKSNTDKFEAAGGSGFLFDTQSPCAGGDLFDCVRRFLD